MHHPISSLLGSNTKPEITGYVAPGYEPVLEIFEKIMSDGMEDKVQSAAFVNGELVVNLVGIVNPAKASHDISGAKYGADSTQNVFSSTKALSSIIIAMLVDRGLLSYDRRICEVWPGHFKYFAYSPTWLISNCRVRTKGKRYDYCGRPLEARGGDGEVCFCNRW
jgi:hypothetical protein